MKLSLLRNRSGSDAATSHDFLRKRLQRAFTRANQLYWTAQYNSLRIKYINPYMCKKIAFTWLLRFWRKMLEACCICFSCLQIETAISSAAVKCVSHSADSEATVLHGPSQTLTVKCVSHSADSEATVLHGPSQTLTVKCVSHSADSEATVLHGPSQTLTVALAVTAPFDRQILMWLCISPFFHQLVLNFQTRAHAFIIFG